MPIDIILWAVALMIAQLIPLIVIGRIHHTARYIVLGSVLLSFFGDGVFLAPAFVLEAHLRGFTPALELNVIFFSMCLLVKSLTILLVIAVAAKSVNQSKVKAASLDLRSGLFGILAITFVTLWIALSGPVAIYSPRTAYMEREGIGFVWGLMIVFSTMWYLTKSASPRVSSTSTALYVSVLFLSASKGLLASFLFYFLANPWINPVSKRRFAIGGAVLGLPMLAYLFGFVGPDSGLGSTSNILLGVTTYFNQFSLSQLVFRDYLEGNLAFLLGDINFSKLWAYVPRAIFEDKPYAWGTAFLVEMYFPSLADSGHTPSFGQWTHYFVDFGFLGALFSVLSIDHAIRLFAIYVVVTWSGSTQMKAASVGVLLLPGFTFHVPLPISLLIFLVLARLSFSYAARIR